MVYIFVLLIKTMILAYAIVFQEKYWNILKAI